MGGSPSRETPQGSGSAAESPQPNTPGWANTDDDLSDTRIVQLAATHSKQSCDLVERPTPTLQSSNTTSHSAFGPGAVVRAHQLSARRFEELLAEGAAWETSTALSKPLENILQIVKEETPIKHFNKLPKPSAAIKPQVSVTPATLVVKNVKRPPRVQKPEKLAKSKMPLVIDTIMTDHANREMKVFQQVRRLLQHYARSNVTDDFTVGYKSLMDFYNTEFLPQQPSLPYGAILGVMKQKKIIYPPENHGIVKFSAEKMRDFLEVYELKLQAANRPNQKWVTKTHAKYQSKKTNSTTSNTAKTLPEPETAEDQRWVDQRKTMQLKQGARASNDHTPPNICKDCGVVNSNNHANCDEHLFTASYRKLLRASKGSGSKDEPPYDLSGREHNLVIQSKANAEGCANLAVDLLQNTKTPEKIELEVSLLKYTEGLNISNICSFILGGEKLSFNQFGRLHLSKYKTKSNITLHMDASSIGMDEFMVVLKFRKSDREKSLQQTFFVMKKIQVRVDDESTREDGEVIITKPAVLGNENDVDGDTEDQKEMGQTDIEQPEISRSSKFRGAHSVKLRKLYEYPIPEEYIQLFDTGLATKDKSWSNVLIAQAEVLGILSGGLAIQNFSKFFSVLLFLEEHQTRADLKTYTMRQAKLGKNQRGYFLLEVPGLAENRPSILKYDDITITLPTGRSFEGKVMALENTQIQISMGKGFQNAYLPNMPVTVYFSFNRMCIKVQHRALELMQTDRCIGPVSFPSTHSKFTSNLPILAWFNKLISTNEQQRQAVQNIVNGTSKPAPYLVFGPPGTGKTVTIVESIKQIWQLYEKSYILATAPSNSAADLLAERVLQSLPPSEVLRLYSPSRNFSQVPEALKRSCNFDGADAVIPEMSSLIKYRVIVCTLVCAARLYTAGFSAGHFSHIFVDECGHAMEPTALVPIAGLQGPPSRPSQLVLSGDPRQLGAVVRSPLAQQLGLGISLLGRLMDTVELYQRVDGQFNPKVLTKLVKNFRSHPDILKVPNELFYESDLQPSGDQLMTYSAVNWEYLPKRGFPLIFHGVKGKEDQEKSSPSYFNISEVSEVVNYVEKILDSKFSGQKVRPADIGIVSPYRGQLSKIHRALQRKGIRGVSVGSVEEFQGQERLVIIISTVRSDPLSLQIDRKYRIGFVKEPKRFNVAVTRAKSLLVVIGNPYLLETDHNWCYLLRHIYKNGGYTGCKYVHDMERELPPAEDHSDDRGSQVVSRFQKLLDENQKITKRLQESEKETVYATDTSVDALMKQLKQMSFFTEEASAMETYVSPPMASFDD